MVRVSWSTRVVCQNCKLYPWRLWEVPSSMDIIISVYPWWLSSPSGPFSGMYGEPISIISFKSNKNWRQSYKKNPPQIRDDVICFTCFFSGIVYVSPKTSFNGYQTCYFHIVSLVDVIFPWFPPVFPSFSLARCTGPSHQAARRTAAPRHGWRQVSRDRLWASGDPPTCQLGNMYVN